MRIILVATEPKGKNLVFVTDDLQAHTSGRAVTLVGMGKIEGVHVVQGKREKYLRSEPNAAVDDNLDTLSISLHVSKRGKQIGSEFYPLARQILQAK